MGIGGAASIALGVVIALFGAIFVLMGAYLAVLGGSWYYVICGLVLVTSGALMVTGKLLGAWLFLVAWLGTIIWTIYEVGFEWWGWLPRDFGPTILAILVVLCVPALRRRDTIRPISRGAV